jgi:hypothetical protein
MPNVLTARMASRAARGAASTLGLVLGSTMLLQLPATAAPGRELSLDFNHRSPRLNAGNTALAVTELRHRGGVVRKVARAGDGTGGVRFPAYRPSNARFAVLTAVDRRGGDALAPGTSRFRFGAEFAINKVSQGNPADNGNNLVQRGLSNGRMQYKLEVDGNRPQCRVRGDDGAVRVQSRRTVAPGVWHRVSCSRNGDKVVLRLVRLSDGASWRYVSTGRTGRLAPASRSVPLSIGGKVKNGGRLAVGSADQFNGRMDNAFYNLF